MKRAELINTLLSIRYDMDCIGEDFDISEELKSLSDTELQQLIADYTEERNQTK